jgi:hypothetical protein
MQYNFRPVADEMLGLMIHSVGSTLCRFIRCGGRLTACFWINWIQFI